MKHLIFLTIALTIYSVDAMDTEQGESITKGTTSLSKDNKQLLTPPGSPSKRKPKHTPTVTVNLNSHISSSNDTSVATTARNNSAVATTTSASSLLKSAKKSYRKYYPKVRNGILHNIPYMITIVCIATSGYIYRQFLLGNQYLQDPTRWSLFKQEIPLRALQDTPTSALIDDLLLTIHRKYISHNNPLNSIEPMAKFLQEIDQETEQLTYYQTLYNRAKMIYAHHIMPAKSELYLTIPARLRRLEVLKDTFIGWVSQVNTKNCYAPSLESL